MYIGMILSRTSLHLIKMWGICSTTIEGYVFKRQKLFFNFGMFVYKFFYLLYRRGRVRELSFFEYGFIPLEFRFTPFKFFVPFHTVPLSFLPSFMRIKMVTCCRYGPRDCPRCRNRSMEVSRRRGRDPLPWSLLQRIERTTSHGFWILTVNGLTGVDTEGRGGGRRCRRLTYIRKLHCQWFWPLRCPV